MLPVCQKTMVLTIRGSWQLLPCPETGDTDLLSFRRAEKGLEHGGVLVTRPAVNGGLSAGLQFIKSSDR